MVASSPGAASPGQPADPLIGAILSRRYRLVSKLGEGGMGVVYEVEPVGGGARLAVKILRPEFLSDDNVRSRFLVEGRACMRLDHPNVLRVFEVAEAEDGSPYLVMERLEGAPLSAYMRPGRPMPQAHAVAIVQGILAALGAAHAQGIVHRDLKPENVFILRGGSGPSSVKLLDFGIAKVMDAAGGMGSRTRTGMLLGTPAYMSPEQARSGRDADTRSDLWSAGVLLYELLAGRQAFVAPNEFARLTLIMTAQAEPLPAESAAFEPFLARALKKDRADRFQSAQQMAQALASVPLGGADPATLAMPAPPSAAPQADPTLSSPSRRPESTKQSDGAGPAPSSRPPPVVMVPPSEPIPPYSFSNPRPIGVSQVVVVMLVTFALMAGFILGFAVARSM